MQDKVANPSNAQYDNGTKSVNDFATKKVAMVINQNNADSSIVANGMKAGEYGVVPFPAPAGGEQVASHVAGINLSIFKNTKNKDAALKFVKYMTDATTQTTLGKPFASLPVLKDAKPVFTTDAAEAAIFHLQHQVQAAAAGTGRGPVREHRRQGDERHVRQDRDRWHGQRRGSEGGAQDG
ncbi:extracellular solute-binding protein [Kribbella catacumbae]|uniref:extracellular solute-binding protein n=1 Tax=Kribbella catacumbae TaxID=460086 RepID=UPI0003A44FC1|nr:extracellular solute-binding protein [Kribbella catacumbae]